MPHTDHHAGALGLAEPEPAWTTGYLQVYTGDGKGKTTAALGLALRAAAAGLNVFVAQFAKPERAAELDMLNVFDEQIVVQQYGREGFVGPRPNDEDFALARQGLADVQAVFESGAHQVVILDEANIAAYMGLFPVEELLRVLDRRPAHVEAVVTGRYADPRLLERADLVTDMREVKHYYSQGVAARDGIER